MDREETAVAGTEAEETTGAAEETTEETGEETAGAGEEQTGEDTEGTDEIQDGEIKGIAGKDQEAVNRRIGKVVARAKAAEERAAAAEKELTELKGKAEGGLLEQVRKLGLSADLVTKDDAQTLDRYRKLRAQKTWCRTHEDGYEGKGGDDESVSAQAVRKRLVEIEDELEEIGASAREIQQRSDKRAREIWAAGLKALSKPAASGGGKKVVKPPQLPSGGGAAAKPPVSARKGKESFDSGEFRKAGANKAALEKQFEKLYP